MIPDVIADLRRRYNERLSGSFRNCSRVETLLRRLEGMWDEGVVPDSDLKHVSDALFPAMSALADAPKDKQEDLLVQVLEKARSDLNWDI